jgi:hypothetical protein
MEKRMDEGREVFVFKCVAICLGAWGGGDAPQDAVKQMVKAYGSRKATERYIAFEAPTAKLRGDGGCLTAYPPTGGKFDGTGFDDITETRYVRGIGFGTGPYGQVKWPERPAKRTKKLTGDDFVKSVVQSLHT